MGRILEQLIRASLNQFGTESTSLSPDGVDLTGSMGSTLLIPANPNSVGLVIGIADDTQKICFISSGAPAVFDAGPSLIPGERFIEIVGSRSKLDLFAITTAAGARISWQQFVSP